MPSKRIYMSVPHMSGREESYVAEAFRSNWLSSVGPHIDGFEREVASLAPFQACIVRFGIGGKEARTC